MCESTILKLETWVADTLHEDYEKIREEVVKSIAVNADETSFRIGGTNGWLWVFTSGSWVHITRLLQPEVTKFRKKHFEGFEGVLGRDAWDRGYNVDFFIKINEQYIGLQIKPAGYAYIPQIINELKFQKETHEKFTAKYGGKVFYIISVKEDKKKVIYNPEVIEEIREEIERLKKT